MRILFIALLFSLVSSSRALALSIDPNRPPWHDWTVTVAHRHYGFGGTSEVTTFHYGSDYATVRIPFFATVASVSLLLLVGAASVWRITRRHDNAA